MLCPSGTKMIFISEGPDLLVKIIFIYKKIIFSLVGQIMKIVRGIRFRAIS